MTRTEHIIAMMIEKAFEAIDYHQDIIKHWTTIKHINKEFRTIRLQLPRQTGQTTAAISVAKQYFKHPLYVCTDIIMINHVKRYIDSDIETLTYSQMKNPEKLVGKAFDCVIIDNASIMNIKDILENRELETISTLNERFLYIIIG